MTDRFSLADLEIPIVQAPMAGGPSTPELAGAVAQAGGLGFLAAGYKTADAVGADIEALRALTARPFGLNIFARPGPAPDPSAVARYAERIAPEAERQGAAVGEARHDDDGFGAKVALAVAEGVAVVSFAFGCPAAAVVQELQAAGAAVWVTVTTPGEAAAARDAGADALIVQGTEAGGHRGGFDDAAPGNVGLLALLQLVRAETELPLVATGGIATGRAVAAVLAAGAAAAQIGSALMLSPEAATSAPHRAAFAAGRATALTRAFSGRTARGIVNRFMTEHEAAAISAYPDVHHLTSPLRAAARAAGDAEAVNLWAGEAHALAAAEPAGAIVVRLAEEARAALREAAARA